MAADLLALAMADRRHELGLTVVEASKRAGIARSTWSDIETRKRERITSSVGLRIDDVLGWVPGTTARAFATNDPHFVFPHGKGADVEVLGDVHTARGARARIERASRQLSDDAAVLVAEIVERLVSLEQLEGEHHQLVAAISRATEHQARSA